LFLTFFKNFRTLKTKLHGFLQNSARPKKVCEKTSVTSAGQRLLGGCLAPRACIGRGAQLIAGDSRKVNGLHCMRPSTLRHAISKWPLKMHTPTKPVVFFDKANVLKPMALLLLPVFTVNNNLLSNPIN
jgi:hypothetical protein